MKMLRHRDSGRFVQEGEKIAARSGGVEPFIKVDDSFAVITRWGGGRIQSAITFSPATRSLRYKTMSRYVLRHRDSGKFVQVGDVVISRVGNPHKVEGYGVDNWGHPTVIAEFHGRVARWHGRLFAPDYEWVKINEE